MNICPFVIDLEHFRRIGIIIDDHACITNDGHATNFTGMEPTYMNMGGHAIRKSEIKMGNVMNV